MNLVDTSASPVSGNVFSSETHYKILVADSQINSFAVYPKDGIFAYSEKQLIKVFKWSLSSGVATTLAEFKIEDDLMIVELCFSEDGRYLASLGGIPSHQITLWNWKAQEKIVSTSNLCAAKYLTFSPQDPKILCTSGDEGIIRFWNIKSGYKKSSMSSVQGLNQISIEPEDIMCEITPNQHYWVNEKTVICSTIEGKDIYSYNIETGAVSLVLSVVHPAADQHLNLSEVIDGSNMQCILKNKFYYVIGGAVCLYL